MFLTGDVDLTAESRRSAREMWAAMAATQMIGPDARQCPPWEDDFLERVTRLVMWLQMRENNSASWASDIPSFNKDEEEALMQPFFPILR